MNEQTVVVRKETGEVRKKYKARNEATWANIVRGMDVGEELPIPYKGRHSAYVGARSAAPNYAFQVRSNTQDKTAKIIRTA